MTKPHAKIYQELKLIKESMCAPHSGSVAVQTEEWHGFDLSKYS